MRDIFHPSVTANERKVWMRSNFYRPSLLLCAEQNNPAKPTLSVGKVEVSPDGVTCFATFITQDGVPVLKFGQLYNQNCSAAVFDSLGTMPSTSIICESERPMYVAKTLFKNTKAGRGFSGVWHAAARVARDIVFTSVRNAHHTMQEGRKMSMNYREMITSSQIGELVRVFFGETLPLNVSTESRQAFEALRAERDRRRSNRMDIFEKMQECFAQPKWFVSYLPEHGYTVRGINVASTWERIIQGEQAVRDLSQYFVPTCPAQFYRTLDELPADIKDSLLASLTLTKMHMQGKYSHLVYDAEPHDLVPRVGGASGFALSPELSAVVFGMNSLSTVMINQ